MSLLRAFDSEFSTPEKNRLLSVTEFAEKWCCQKLTLPQTVIMKLYADEPLSTRVKPPYRISEQQWFEEMVDRGRFPANTYERVQERRGKGFTNILLSMGRRSGKSTMIGIAALYTVYKVLMHDDPQAYYGIQTGDVIEIAVAATTDAQSRKGPFMKIVNFCKDAVANGTPLAEWIDKEGIQSKTIYFKTRQDKKQEDDLKRKKSKSMRNASVQIAAYNSNIDAFRGNSVIAGILDEFALIDITNDGYDPAEYFYSTLSASIPQFKGDGRMFILSTPKGRAGKFYSIYQDVYSGKTRSTIGIRMPTWEAWEYEPDPLYTLQSLSDSEDIPFIWDKEIEDAEEAIERAPASFKREFGAEFEGAEDQWIPSFYLTTEHEERGFFRPHLKHEVRGRVGKVYAAHADPARTNDAFAIVLAHKEIHDGKEIVVIDQAVRWFVAPYPTYEERDYEFIIRQTGPEPAFIHTSLPVNYMKENILDRFNVSVFTFDQGQGTPAFIDDLALHAQKNNMLYTRIDTVHATQNHNKAVSDLFEQLVLEERIWCYNHPILQEELLNLKKDEKGRVANGPGTHDDLFDAISNVCMHVMELPLSIEGGAGGYRGRAFSLTPQMPSARF